MMQLLLAAGHKHPTWADFGPVEWVAIVVAGLLAAWSVWKAVLYTVRPGEEDPCHIKRSILYDEMLQARTVAADGQGTPAERATS
ncbi:MAG: hypothetical protein O2894_07510 [Planctomycetota bacterium]|nr:hypothetical protein [Planctomycetota bacterium]